MNSTYHPHRRDGHSYYGDTYATSRRRRSPVARLRRWLGRMKERVETGAAWLIVAAFTVLAVAAWAAWFAEG